VISIVVPPTARPALGAPSRESSSAGARPILDSDWRERYSWDPCEFSAVRRPRLCPPTCHAPAHP
jgi:hypothetical protein